MGLFVSKETFLMSLKTEPSLFSFPPFPYYTFCIKRNFAPLGSIFCVQTLTVRTLERKKDEWWHLVNKLDLETLVETQLKCFLLCEAFSTFPGMRPPCPSCPQSTLVIARGVNNMLCEDAFCWTVNSAGSPGFLSALYLQQTKESMAYRYRKRHPSNYQKSKHRAL